jgi:predicted transcriptional regulator
MQTTLNSPLSLCAADLMSRDVVLLPAEMSLPAAARLLCRRQISGAPVVDEHGRCVGILSASDFMQCIEKEAKAGEVFQRSVPVYSAWEILEDTEIAPTCLVQDFMKRDPVTVAASACLGELARTMLEAHIHRLIVVDHENKPLGIVSTGDILTTLARAAGIGVERPCDAAYADAAAF